MKPLVIYHASCADGFAAAFAAWSKFGDEAEYLPMQYGGGPEVQDIRDLCDEREVYVLDFSFPRPVMDALFECAAHVVWLDHHKTAFEMWLADKPDFAPTAGKERFETYGLATGRKIVLDPEKSGAVLAWEYFHPGTEVPLLIKHIDDYDRWQFKIARY